MLSWTTGPQEPQGLASGIIDYLYIYNTTQQTVEVNADILYNTSHILTPGFTFIQGQGTVGIVNAGIYDITFSVSGTQPNQFALFASTQVLEPSSIYGSGAGTQQNTGFTILSLAAGDTLQVRNYVSAAAVTLATPIGGTAASINASLKILRLA